MQLPPGQIEPLLARKRVELGRLDLVGELDRLAAGWNPVEPAPAGELAVVHPEHVIRDRVAVVEVVEQPPVDARRFQLTLNPCDVRHRFLLP
jgi:hypothetical protein